MKFGKQLALNAVPEWNDDYVHYATLKTAISTAVCAMQAAQQVETSGKPLSESLQEPLTPQSSEELPEVVAFFELLQKELDRVNSFFEKHVAMAATAVGKAKRRDIKERQSGAESADTMRHRASTMTRKLSIFKSNASEGDRESLIHPAYPSSLYPTHDVESAFASDSEDGDAVDSDAASSPDVHAPDMTTGSSLVQLYGRLQDLQQYRTLNHEAFRKALKKWDKNTGRSDSASYLSRVEATDLWQRGAEVEGLKDTVEAIYTEHVWTGNKEHARGFLEANTRELIVFRRNVIWKDMVLAESKRQAVGVHGSSIWTFKLWPLIAALVVFVVLLATPLDFIGDDRAQRCFAMLVFLVVLWVTEAVPLYVTSLMVPFLSVVLSLVPNQSAKNTSKIMVHAMMSEVIILILGGFTIASALSKFGLDNALATWIISKSGTKPRYVGLAVMMVGAFLSMFLSNVAAPVLCISVMTPMLRSLPRTSTFARQLLLGIAFACNIGGMMTPIASPQNVFAVQAINEAFDNAGVHATAPSFGQWLLVAVPLGTVLILLAHFVIFTLYAKPDIQETPAIPFRANKLGAPEVFTISVTVLTIALWVVDPMVEDHIGPEGLIGTVPLVLLYGAGILRKEDFNSLPWNVVFLVAGGLSLSTAVQESSLLNSITDAITSATDGQSLWVVLVAFVLLISVVTSLISHTVGAIIILPVVAQVTCPPIGATGECDVIHTQVLVLCCAFMCSGAMMLPISSFPNVSAVSFADELGKTYLQPSDIVKTGGPFTIVTALGIVGLGYALSLLTFEVI